MKTLLFSLIVLIPIVSFSQNPDSVVTLIQERHIALNSGSRALIGGKSRESIKVDLPEGTKYWYYSFSTSADYSGTNSLNLAFQIAGAISSSGSLSSLASYIEVPIGTGSADILLCDYENINKFMAKDDKWGTPISRYKEGTVQNTKQGVVAIDDVTSGTVYLGLRNPAGVDAIDISIEVVAVVDYSYEVTWPIEVRAMMREEFLNHLQESEVEVTTANEIAACMTDYLVSNYSLTDAVALSESDPIGLEEELMSHCIEDENTCEQKDQAETYGSLGWTYFESGKIDESIKYSKKALELCDQNMTWVEANIALAYLALDSTDLALDYYVRAISSSKNSKLGKQWIKEAVEDLEEYELKYGIIGRHPEVKDLLEMEL